MITEEEAKMKMQRIANYLHTEAKAKLGIIEDALDVLKYLEGKENGSDILNRYEPSVQGITVLDYIKNNGSATTDDAMNLLERSQASVSALFRGLVLAGILTYRQDSRKKRYVVKDRDSFEAVLKEYGGFSRYKSAEESSKPI